MPDPISGPGLVEHFASRLPAMLDDLESLINCESPSADLAAVKRSAALVSDIGARLLGAEPETLVIDGCTHLRWRLGTGDRRVLVLAHHDTVWPIGSLETHPYGVEDGIVRGPGSFDMLVGLVMAFYALAELGDDPTVTLLVTGDEEIGSTTSRELIETEAAELRRRAGPGAECRRRRPEGTAQGHFVVPAECTRPRRACGAGTGEGRQRRRGDGAPGAGHRGTRRTGRGHHGGAHRAQRRHHAEHHSRVRPDHRRCPGLDACRAVPGGRGDQGHGSGRCRGVADHRRRTEPAAARPGRVGRAAGAGPAAGRCSWDWIRSPAPRWVAVRTATSPPVAGLRPSTGSVPWAAGRMLIMNMRWCRPSRSGRHCWWP